MASEPQSTSNSTTSNPTSRSRTGRSRSHSVSSEHPFDTPLTASDAAVAGLIRTINAENQRARSNSIVFAPVQAEAEATEVQSQQAQLHPLNALLPDLPSFDCSDPYSLFKCRNCGEIGHQIRDCPTVDPVEQERAIDLESRIDAQDLEIAIAHVKEETRQSTISQAPTHTIKRSGGCDIEGKMSAYNYMESGGGPSNPRQAPPSPSQGMNHGNGMNGSMGMGGGMGGFPTPAGHQSDLNFIMSMVDELSRNLESNQRMTQGVVEKIGKVSERAKGMNLTNDELIALVSQEMEEESRNMEKELSQLRKQLQKSEFDADENWKLVIHACNILADITEKVHKFKEQNESDVLAWHKNYRKQLAVERETNLHLNNHMNDMRASAARANEYLRLLRRAIFDDEDTNKIKMDLRVARLLSRSWKRMALPLMLDDDSDFSDDDDIKDPVLRHRLEELKQEAEVRAESGVKRKKGKGKAKAKKYVDVEAAGDEGNGKGPSATL